jgi:hypothetical protein
MSAYPYYRNSTIQTPGHAAEIFNTAADLEFLKTAPKLKWLFHCSFDINRELITDNQSIFPESWNPSILVKTTDLPKFQVTVQELNQYNRKVFVQTKINYEPLRITFHDDHDNNVLKLWNIYARYNYYDFEKAARATGQRFNRDLNMRNIYQNEMSPEMLQWGYSGSYDSANYSLSKDSPTYNAVKAPVFNSITIYGLSQHYVTEYKLINPVIQDWSHDSYNYSDATGTMEHSLTIRYSAVGYSSGSLRGSSPSDLIPGFGIDGQYDRRESPITRIQLTNKSIDTVTTSTGVVAGGWKRDIITNNTPTVTGTTNPNSYKPQRARVLNAFSADTRNARSGTVIPAPASINNIRSQTQTTTNTIDVPPAVPTKDNTPIVTPRRGNF